MDRFKLTGGFGFSSASTEKPQEFRRMTAPPRIWAHCEDGEDGLFIEHLSDEPWPGDDVGVEYVRADLLNLALEQAAQLAIKHDTHHGTALAEMIRGLGNGGGWQPIETAPKDGTRVLTFGCLHDDHGCNMGEVSFVRNSMWHDGMGSWVAPCSGSHEPTHWMPIPAPPSALATPEGE